jgi:hypothetical protein
MVGLIDIETAMLQRLRVGPDLNLSVSVIALLFGRFPGAWP